MQANVMSLTVAFAIQHSNGSDKRCRILRNIIDTSRKAKRATSLWQQSAIGHGTHFNITEMVIRRSHISHAESICILGQIVVDIAERCTPITRMFIAAISKDTTLFNVESAKKYSNQVLASVDKKWLEENAKKPGVKVLPDGLQYKVITEGHGAIPKATDEVEVIYEGKTTDGKVFDATSKHGKKTDTFNAGNLIKGWTEALTMMPVGSKWEIYIPSELAYGEHRAGQIAPYSTLIFTLELVNIVEPQKKEEKKK